MPIKLDNVGGSSIGGMVTGGTSGSVIYVDSGGNLAQDNSNFFWDATNKRLGIGTASPTAELHVLGTTNTTGSSSLIVSGGDNVGIEFQARFLNLSVADGPQAGFVLGAPNSTFATDRNWSNNINVGAHGDFGILVSSSSSTFPTSSANLVMQILSNGNVGIGQGVINPSTLLYLKSSTTTTLTLQNTANGGTSSISFLSKTVAGANNNWTIGTEVNNDVTLEIAKGGTRIIDLSLATQNFLTTISGSSIIGHVIKGAASQSADLQQWQDSSGNVLGLITKDGGFVFNENSIDVDSRIEGDTDANLFYTDAGNDRVGIGTASPSDKFSVLAKFDVSANGLITKYNNIATAAWGVPAIYGQGRSTAQTGDVASVATYTVGGSDGSFWISSNINVTAYTAGTQNVKCDYTDETNTARTFTFTFSSLTGTLLTSIGATGPFESFPAHIRCKASTSITIKTTGTAWNGTYNVEGAILQIA